MFQTISSKLTSIDKKTYIRAGLILLGVGVGLGLAYVATSTETLIDVLDDVPVEAITEAV